MAMTERRFHVNIFNVKTADPAESRKNFSSVCCVSSYYSRNFIWNPINPDRNQIIGKNWTNELSSLKVNRTPLFCRFRLLGQFPRSNLRLYFSDPALVSSCFTFQEGRRTQNGRIYLLISSVSSCYCSKKVWRVINLISCFSAPR